jgi:membrane protein required for colicin V production
MPISWLDVILIIIMLVSDSSPWCAVHAEVLSIFSWAVAAVAALYLTPKYWQTVESYFPSPAFAQIGFAAGVFIITLIVVSLITFRISDRVLDSRVGALDRTMGFIFGLAAASCSWPSSFILFSALARDQPTWITEAKSYPILKQTQVAIESLMPLNPSNISRAGSTTKLLKASLLRPAPSRRTLRCGPRRPRRTSVEAPIRSNGWFYAY